MEKEKLKPNEEKLLEAVTELAPDIALLISYLAHLGMSSEYLVDVVNQVYKVSSGSGSGKISIVVEGRRIRSVHGIENRWVDKDIFISE